ncbi:MAG TPA: hypothetical protein VHF87_21700 [Methylomirabilota bacterium]|jgi:hypothetical protein|nr:hypothetical protein [Methylomirabilota bacterium]
MKMMRWGWFRLLPALVAVLLGSPVGAADREARSDLDVLALYDRLTPGMSLRDVAAVAGGQLGTTPEPVTTWVLWNPMPDGKGTAVLRAAFQDGRVIRLEFESFGVEYRRLVKGADPWVEIASDELARIWRQNWKAGRAAERCRSALDAYHHVVLGAQERLTSDEQRAWARALLLRQEAERHLLPSAH